VIKITGNPRTYNQLQDDMDINAGTIITGKENIEDVGDQIFDMIKRVASGEQTKSELYGHNQFSITRLGPTM
jgi:altronate dehydratase